MSVITLFTSFHHPVWTLIIIKCTMFYLLHAHMCVRCNRSSHLNRMRPCIPQGTIAATGLLFQRNFFPIWFLDVIKCQELKQNLKLGNLLVSHCEREIVTAKLLSETGQTKVFTFKGAQEKNVSDCLEFISWNLCEMFSIKKKTSSFKKFSRSFVLAGHLGEIASMC